MIVRLIDQDHAKKVHLPFNKPVEVSDHIGNFWVDHNLAEEIKKRGRPKTKEVKPQKDKMVKNAEVSK